MVGVDRGHCLRHEEKKTVCMNMERYFTVHMDRLYLHCLDLLAALTAIPSTSLEIAMCISIYSIVFPVISCVLCRIYLFSYVG